MLKAEYKKSVKGLINGMKEKLNGMLEKVRRQPKREKKSKYSSLLKFVFHQFTEFFVKFYKNYNSMSNLDIPNIQKNLKEFTDCLNFELIEKVKRVDKKVFEIESLKEELESKKIKYFNIINASEFKSLTKIQNSIQVDKLKGAFL